MKVALITGANSGLGLSMTIELLKSGYTVIATMRNLNKQLELIQKVEQLDLSNYLTVQQMDVTKLAEIEYIKSYVQEQFGQLHILINNAGYCEGGFLEDITINEWTIQQETNIFGTYQVTKTFLPLLEKVKGTKIINMSSVSGFFGFPGMSAYTTSKFAIEGLSESLRLELLPKGIFVSVVEPASYKTKIWEKGLEKVKIINNQTNQFKQNLYKYAQASANHGSDPVEVAKLIVKISKQRKPKFRYTIGKGAKTLSILKRILPWRLIEKIVTRKLNK
ncbi:SDR family oxidoreductase [Metabacillus malikii]|uniref:NAD(P)-dependent dehydrogenase (Short-subunit alcohol dehydrogenase family) n=1 Tax=Metabacillus malikii TaxID=1504265 RepID=A0ABT9ZCL3_9BACI|nr:SDR family oxidoreductase [Metabacillus malikii]MDQ0229982.1 NAD(P)-dependent dehydrogenase (short-subunit alcohol dehydrogenase family) [Metabacillus malikii]